ncbi:MFS transporter [Cellulosimicrobium cellulans]|uniref:MFS transporter n=1 Tax=Cellulosimicrobium cellulans TaxID=1710 RepID=UPI0030174D1E
MARERPALALAGVVFASVAVAAAAGAGTPLLALYRSSWDLPLWQLTAAFAIYAATLLVTLLVAGSLSDHIGRRPVLLGALGAMIVASCLFLVDDGIGWVLVARALQGAATGAATSTFTAAIVELSSARRRPLMTVVTSAAPVGGLALGALLTGASLDLVTDPTRVVFAVLIVSFTIGIVSVHSARETSARVPGALAALRPRLEIPAPARQVFTTVAPLIAAGWMFSGLFLGLGPTFDRVILGVDSGTGNGVVVALAPAAAALFGIPFARIPARRAAGLGALLMVAGAALAVAGFVTAQLPMLAVGALVGGAGQGAGFGSSLRLLGDAADNTDRGGLFSAAYLVAYTAYGLPVLVSGWVAGSVDLRVVLLAYGAIVAALGLWALAALLLSGRETERRRRGRAVAQGLGATVIARDVSKTYRDSLTEVTAVRAASLVLRRGELVAIVGPSGSGKSTLLACLAGLERTTSGRVSVLGHDLATTGRREQALLRREHVGFVFQSYNLISSLTAQENVELPLRLAKGGAAAAMRASAALDAVGLGPEAQHRPAQLSGGQQQRVAIARALAVEPEVVFADEPTGALDTGTGAEILNLLRGIADTGGSVLLVTHDVTGAAAADRVLVLRDGTIVDEIEQPTAERVFAALHEVGRAA